MFEHHRATRSLWPADSDAAPDFLSAAEVNELAEASRL